ncbi:transglycosylase domain-containing protein [Nannocystaceae bacterium ST9]
MDDPKDELDTPLEARSGRSRRSFGWGLGLLLASTAAAMPAWAESEAESRLRDRLGDEFSIAMDLGGVELRGLSREFAGGRGTLTIDRLVIRPGDAGLIVEIEGLEGRLRREAPLGRPTPPKVDPPTKNGAAAPGPSSRDRLAQQIERLVGHLHGVPVEVRSSGQIDVELPGGLSLIAHDPGLHVDAQGRLAAQGRFVAGTGARAWLSGALELESRASDPFALALDGSLVVDPAGVARELRMAGTASPSQMHVELDDPSGGHASVDARREQTDHVELIAEALPLALLDPIVELIERRDPSSRKPPAVGEARLSGRVEIERKAGRESRIRARFDRVELEQLVIERDWLAARPVHFGPLAIDGELTIERSREGQRSAGQLVLGHAGVQLHVGGQLDAERLDVGVELPTTECQALLDAMPEGTAPVLAGSELSGDLSARFGLDLDFAALAEARATYLGDAVDEHEFDRAVERGSFVAPGELEFDFPFLERCRVDRLGPAVDVAGLAGPYHHEFVEASGERSRRVLAPGDPGYVEIAAIPQLELAFVILEDWRFWDHDGFDRDQIAKAFWYDLMAGRTRRGASTISQQTARSLWLRLDHGPGQAPGFDRSVARKLVEALLTAELEREVDKRRILEVYLNIVELGPEVRGVTEAARYHFGKRPQDLDLLEALHLASLAPAPVGYSRRFASGSIDAQWRDHLRLQIRRLRIRGMISEEVADRYLANTRLDLVAHAEPSAAPR